MINAAAATALIAETVTEAHAAVTTDSLLSLEGLVALSTIALVIVTVAATGITWWLAIRAEHGQQTRMQEETNRHAELEEAEEHRHAERMAEIDAEADKATAKAQEALAKLLEQTRQATAAPAAKQ